MISGLHACKPGNEPVVGQVKTFVVQQMTSQNGKAYTKIKSAFPDKGGQPYRIVSAKPTGHTDSYGNISFNIEVEPSQISDPRGEMMHNTPMPQMQPGRIVQDDRSSRIERQHSQEMAIRYCALTNKIPTTDELRTLINWFQLDIGHAPEAPARPEPQRTVGDQIHGEMEPPPDDEPF